MGNAFSVPISYPIPKIPSTENTNLIIYLENISHSPIIQSHAVILYLET